MDIQLLLHQVPVVKIHVVEQGLLGKMELDVSQQEEVLWMPVRTQEVNGDGHVSMKKCVHKIEIMLFNNIFKEPKESV